MKGFWKVIEVMSSVFVAVAELVEFLFIPAILVLVGVLYKLPWKFYAIFVGGYFALFLICELVSHLIFKALHKKYASRFAGKIDKIIARFSKDTENPPKKDN